MYVTHFTCLSCKNPKVAKATVRYHDILNGNINDEEIFKLLDIYSLYPQYINLKNKMSEKEAFIQLMKVNTEYNIKYSSFIKKRRDKIETRDIYKILNIERLCCIRSIVSLPVWPNYNTNKPPGSLIELDTGEIPRYAKRINGKYITGESNIYIKSGIKIINDVQFTVDDIDIQNLKV